MHDTRHPTGTNAAKRWNAPTLARIAAKGARMPGYGPGFEGSSGKVGKNGGIS